MDTPRKALKKTRGPKKPTKKPAKSRKEIFQEQVEKQRRDFFEQVQFECTMASIIMQLFMQLETTAIERIRESMSEYRAIIAKGLTEVDPATPEPQYSQITEAVSESWAVFQSGDKENTFPTFLRLLSTKPETQVKQESVSRIESDQSQSMQEEIQLIDSPSLYRLLEPEQITPLVIDGRIAREDLDDDFKPLVQSLLSDGQRERMLSGSGLF